MNSQKKFSYLSPADFAFIKQRKIAKEDVTTQTNSEIAKDPNFPTDIPDYIPNPPTDLEIFGEDGCKVFLELEMQLREFNENRKKLSATVSTLPEKITEKWQLAVQNQTILPEQENSLKKLFENVIEHTTIISQLDDPFPVISSIMEGKPKSSLDFSEIMVCFNNLHDTIVNPIYNEDFKNRAASCVFLTLNYKKILTTPLDIKNDMNNLIVAMQNVMQLHLYAERALKNLLCLGKYAQCHTENILLIQNTILNISDLKSRSDVIAHATNKLMQDYDEITAYQPEYKCNDEFTIKFILNLVSYVMETKIAMESKETLLELTLKKIINEYKYSDACMIYPCDVLYHDMITALKNSLSARKDSIDALSAELKVIHENSSLNSKIKLDEMKQLIMTTCINLENTLGRFGYFSGYSMFGRGSRLVDELANFVRGMNKYSIHDHIRFKQYCTIKLGLLDNNSLFSQVFPREITQIIANNVAMDTHLKLKR